MTISATYTPAQASGNGVTVAFPFTFKTFEQADLVVIITDADDVDTTQTITTHYTVSLNADQNNNPGGTVTMLTAPVSGTTLTIARVIDALQETDIANGGGFYPEVLEDAFDRLTMLSQQNADEIGRSLTIPVTSQGISTELPNPSANEILAWNSSGDGIVSLPASTIAQNVVAGTPVIDTFNGGGSTFVLSLPAGVIENIDLYISGVHQAPTDDFTYVEATKTITTTSVTPAGTDNVLVKYVGDQAAVAVPADGSITDIKLALSAPALGTPASGNLANCTFPTLNQNTTGSAATLTTARTIGGVSFNGSANITVATATGGFTVSGGNFASRGITDSATTTALTLSGSGANSVTIANSATSPTIGTSAGSLQIQPAGIVAAIFSVGASTGNYFDITGSVSGGNPVLFARGVSDADVQFSIASKGAGNVAFLTGGGSVLQVYVSHTAGATTYLTLTGGNAGNPTISTAAGGNITITPSVQFGGRLGVGIAPNAAVSIYTVFPTTTAAAQEYAGYFAAQTAVASGIYNKMGFAGIVQTLTGYTGTGQMIGVYGLSSNVNNGLTINQLTGVLGIADSSATGTISTMAGIKAQITNSGGATVTNGFSVVALDHSVGTSAAVGFWTNMSAGATKYGLLLAGTAQNYSLGEFGIGIVPSTSTQLVVAASTTAKSSFRVPHGAAPTSPVDGDMWTTTAGVFFRINGVNKTVTLT